MSRPVLIEQSAKNIKLAEIIVLAALFLCIAGGLGGMYLSLPLGIACSVLPDWRSLLSSSSELSDGGGMDERYKQIIGTFRGDTDKNDVQTDFQNSLSAAD